MKTEKQSHPLAKVTPNARARFSLLIRDATSGYIACRNGSARGDVYEPVCGSGPGIAPKIATRIACAPDADRARLHNISEREVRAV